MSELLKITALGIILGTLFFCATQLIEVDDKLNQIINMQKKILKFEELKDE